MCVREVACGRQLYWRKRQRKGRAMATSPISAAVLAAPRIDGRRVVQTTLVYATGRKPWCWPTHPGSSFPGQARQYDYASVRLGVGVPRRDQLRLVQLSRRKSSL